MLNRYSSLAALIALGSSPGFALLLGERQIAWLAGFLNCPWVFGPSES